MHSYNAGASSNISYDGSSISYSPNIPWWKEIQGFWIDWASEDPASTSWDWTQDANQVNLLKLAAARGLDSIEVFSNSPIWWMCGKRKRVFKTGDASYFAVASASGAYYCRQP